MAAALPVVAPRPDHHDRPAVADRGSYQAMSASWSVTVKSTRAGRCGRRPVGRARAVQPVGAFVAAQDRDVLVGMPAATQFAGDARRRGRIVDDGQQSIDRVADERRGAVGLMSRGW